MLNDKKAAVTLRFYQAEAKFERLFQDGRFQTQSIKFDESCYAIEKGL